MTTPGPSTKRPDLYRMEDRTVDYVEAEVLSGTPRTTDPSIRNLCWSNLDDPAKFLPSDAVVHGGRCCPGDAALRRRIEKAVASSDMAESVRAVSAGWMTARELLACFGAFTGENALAGPAELLFRAKAGMVEVPR